VIKDGPVVADGIKLIRLFSRSPDMPVDEFQAYWRDEYGPLIASLPSLERYVQYHARAGGYTKGRQPAYDGFDMTWFGSVEALRDAVDSTAFERSRGNQRNFLASGDCPQIIAREHVITG
jgi:uncharacterized protein (TIGR02118 family)